MVVKSGLTGAEAARGRLSGFLINYDFYVTLC